MVQREMKRKSGQFVHTVFILRSSKAVKTIWDGLKSPGGKKTSGSNWKCFTQEVRDLDKIYRNRKAVFDSLQSSSNTTESQRG